MTGLSTANTRTNADPVIPQMNAAATSGATHAMSGNP
nr:hypothetical protein BJQ95_03625 [Cryobacterium sp. SO1]